MQIDFDQSTPIYLQIIDEIKRLLVTGGLIPGAKLPSQRDLAAELQVNANTVQRAYREMEVLGLVETLRGQGTFVNSDTEIVERVRQEMLGRLVEDFVRSMQALGCTEQSIVQLVQNQLKEQVRATNNGEVNNR